MQNFKNKKIAVLGKGLEGQSSFDFLKKQGADVTLLDEKDDPDYLKNLDSYDLIVRSPGIRLDKIQNSKFKIQDSKVTSQTKIFFDLCPSPIIGVTGTKGKGTTSSLIYEMLKQQGKDAYLGGNIGVPPLTFIDKLKTDSIVVLELSSFQLMDLTKSPHIAVMLMTTSEHLDWHKDVYEYIDAKRNILRFQTPNDFAILNRDYPASNESDNETPAKIYKVSREQSVEQGCFVRNNVIYINMSGREEKVIDIGDILLPGRHNLENVCSAIVVAIFGGAQMKAIVHVLKTFRGLEHRLELVAEVGGVRYYDDSFSTTPETAIAAIEAFDSPEILILGGSSKKSDFSQLGQIIFGVENVKAIIGIGDEWEKIKKEIKTDRIKIIEGLKSMEEVVKTASEIAENGDVVLLSPACASFGMFENYKDRGEQFKKEVNKLSTN